MKSYKLDCLGIIVISIIILIMQSCEWDYLGDKNTDDNSLPKNQDYYFEVQYLNFAWGYNHHGLYIDKDGNCFSYKFNSNVEPWQHKSDSGFTKVELENKFSQNKEFKIKIDDKTLNDKINLISLAKAGKLTDGQHICADFGAITYIAYEFDKKDSLYKPIYLYQAGDLAFKNLSVAANTLYRWLRFEIEGEKDDPGCKPE
jgi:hypothetical protein